MMLDVYKTELRLRVIKPSFSHLFVHLLSLCSRLKAMTDDILKREKELILAQQEHETEWIRMKESVEKELIHANQTVESVQEERVALQSKEHELEMERREIASLKLRLESEATSHIQVRIVFCLFESRCVLGKGEYFKGLGDSFISQRGGVCGVST